MDLFNVFSILIQTLKFWKSVLDSLNMSKNVVWVLLVSENLGYVRIWVMRIWGYIRLEHQIYMSSFFLRPFMKQVDF